MKIYERGGESVETYLPEAARIIESNNQCFRELTKRIMFRAIERSTVMSITGGRNSFKLLTEDEIQEIWTAYQSRQ
jgi:hypothetical protein